MIGKKAILVSVFLVFIILLSPLTPVVNAYTELYTLPYGVAKNPDNKVIHLSGGKYVYVTDKMVSGDNPLYGYIFSALGAYLSSFSRSDLQIDTDIFTGAVTALMLDFSLFEYNATTAGLFIMNTNQYSANNNLGFGLYTINTSTGEIKFKTSALVVFTYSLSITGSMSQIIRYDATNWYVSVCASMSTLSYLRVYKITSSYTITGYSYTATGDGVVNHQIFMQYSTVDAVNTYYMITSFSSANTPKIYKFGVVSTTITTIGESSMTEIFPTEYANTKFASMELLQYENFYYLSFNYVYCRTLAADIYYRTVTVRMIYNTSITLAYLIAQNHRYYDVVPHGYTSAVGLNVAKLYFRSDYDRFTLYYQRIDDGTYKWTKDQIIIPDYYSTSSEQMYRDEDEYVQDISVYGEEIPINTVQFGVEQIVREVELMIQFNVYVFANGGKVYSVTPLQTSYDITFSLDPDVQPLLLNNQYEFTITAYQAGAPYVNGMLYIYANNVIYIQQLTDIVGKVEFLKTFTIGGNWNLTVKIMVGGLSVYEESHLYVVSFTQGEEETPEEAAGGNLQQVMNYLIPSIALLFPVGLGIGALYQHPEIGLMVGLTIGGVIAVWSQLIPMYVLIIIVIVDIMIIFLGRNSGGNSGL